ncbi:ATP-binding protein [Streptomyces sp. A5-4]|uniref:ATP-binding protein n=1 Tax=Streptomyces sp. A5-4 TaxID=3384771 RepID=UPI003DA7B106
MNGDTDLGDVQAQRIGGGSVVEGTTGGGSLADAAPDGPVARDGTGEAVHGAGGAVRAGRRAWAGAAYDGTPGAIGDARRFVVGFLAQLTEEHRGEISSRVAGAAQLVVSELVTNACKYAPGPCVVNVELDGPALEITVWDTDPALPVPREAKPGRVGGHGLEIVRALCESFEVLCEPIGKKIKARIPVRPADGMMA